MNTVKILWIRKIAFQERAPPWNFPKGPHCFCYAPDKIRYNPKNIYSSQHILDTNKCNSWLSTDYKSLWVTSFNILWGDMNSQGLYQGTLFWRASRLCLGCSAVCLLFSNEGKKRLWPGATRISQYLWLVRRMNGIGKEVDTPMDALVPCFPLNDMSAYEEDHTKLKRCGRNVWVSLWISPVNIYCENHELWAFSWHTTANSDTKSGEKSGMMVLSTYSC